MSHGQLGIAVPYLRPWRLYVVLKQSELADKAGVGRSTVARGEQGGSISVDNARALAAALGISVQQLRDAPPGSSIDMRADSHG